MKIIKHQYILNTFFLLGFIFLALTFTINKYPLSLKFQSLVLACLVYLIWAYLFHHLDKSLNTFVILEYVLFATLVIILLAGFIT